MHPSLSTVYANIMFASTRWKISATFDKNLNPYGDSNYDCIWMICIWSRWWRIQHPLLIPCLPCTLCILTHILCEKGSIVNSLILRHRIEPSSCHNSSWVNICNPDGSKSFCTIVKMTNTVALLWDCADHIMQSWLVSHWFFLVYLKL